MAIHQSQTDELIDFFSTRSMPPDPGLGWMSCDPFQAMMMSMALAADCMMTIDTPMSTRKQWRDERGRGRPERNPKLITARSVRSVVKSVG
jgi:hypothetical protein